MPRVTFRCSTELLEQLKDHADQDNLTVSDAVRTLVEYAIGIPDDNVGQGMLNVM